MRGGRTRPSQYVNQNPRYKLQQTFSGGVESYVSVAGVFYKVHTFSDTGTTALTSRSGSPGLDTEYLVVAGGGGGGRSGGGGGRSGGGGNRSGGGGGRYGSGARSESRFGGGGSGGGRSGNHFEARSTSSADSRSADSRPARSADSRPARSADSRPAGPRFAKPKSGGQRRNFSGS